MVECLIPKYSTIKGDPHVHTALTDSTLLPSKTVLKAAEYRMNWVALTDHNLTPSNRAYDEALSGVKGTRYEGRIAVFKGAELDIKHKGVVGHVVVFFSPEHCSRSLERSAIAFLHKSSEPDLVDVAKWTRDEDGVMVITHPDQWGILSFPDWAILDAGRQIMDQNIEVARGMEVATCSCKVFPNLLRTPPSKLYQLAKASGFAPAAASDAHSATFFGKAYTITYASRNIANEEDEYRSVQTAFLEKDTWPSVSRMGAMNPHEIAQLQLEIGLAELLKVGGRYFIKENDHWDPYYAWRYLYYRLGLISSQDLKIAQDLKRDQETFRQQVFQEDGLNQYARTHIRLIPPTHPK